MSANELPNPKDFQRGEYYFIVARITDHGANKRYIRRSWITLTSPDNFEYWTPCKTAQDDMNDRGLWLIRKLEPHWCLSIRKANPIEQLWLEGNFEKK